MVQNINGSTFNQNTRFTKKGNPYQKTNTAKWAGIGIGAGVGIAKNAEILLNMQKVTQELEAMIDNLNIKELFQNITPNDKDFLEYQNIRTGIKKDNVDCSSLEYQLRQNFDEFGWVFSSALCPQRFLRDRGQAVCTSELASYLNYQEEYGMSPEY